MFIVTNGSLLTEARAQELIDAGLDQISISLNYLDERQDTERKLPGLWRHLSELIPRIAGRGCTVLANTVVMRENLDQIMPIARQMEAWGAGVSYSCYTHFKNGNREHYFPPEELPQLEAVVAEMIAHKKRVGNIHNSNFYLERIVPYFRDRDGIGGCKAGNAFIQLTPDGQVRQCADFAPFVHYTEYRGMEPTPCTRCWYACRGESEASFDFGRVAELLHRT
jgi:MoaA/NifB/PqqE/SkfB family radical SAM enzyme